MPLSSAYQPHQLLGWVRKLRSSPVASYGIALGGVAVATAVLLPPMKAATKMGCGICLAVRMMACGLNAARHAASSDSRRNFRDSSTARLNISSGTSSAAGSLSISPALF